MTSIGSHLLSPPVSTPPASSPPPKLESEDYVGVKTKKRQWGRKGKGRGRKQRRGQEASDETIASPVAVKSGPSTLASRDSYGTAYNSSQKDPKHYHPIECTLPRSATFPNTGGPRNAQQPTLLRIHTLMHASTEPKANKETHSLALESLRRYDCQRGQQANSKLRRLSESLETAIGKVMPMDRNPTMRSLGNKSSRGTQPATLGLDQSDQIPKDNLMSTNTPASITLRKPSKAVTLMSSPVPETMANSPVAVSSVDSKIEYSELVAFRSIVKGSNTLGEPEKIPLHSKVRTRSSTISLGSSERESPKGLIERDDLKSTRRSRTASTVLTFADTHVTLGIFAAEPKRRQASVASGFQSRRLSMVQLLSSDSIHEIIWREGESTSDSSSPNRASAEHAGSSSRRESAPYEDSMSGGKSRGNKDTKVHCSGLNNAVLNSLDQQMLEWTWGVNADPPIDMEEGGDSS